MCLVAQSVTKSVRLFVTPWTTACQDPLFMGILQAKILEWVAIPFSTLFSWPMDRTCVSCISRQILYCLSHQGNPERKWKWKSLQSCLTLWDPMDYSPPGSSVHGILHWSGLPFPSPGNPPNPEIKPGCPTLWADSLPPGSHWISHMYTCVSSFLDFLPIQASSERWVEFPALCSWFSLVIWSTQSAACESIPVSLFTPPPLPLVSICLFCTSASLFLCFVVQSKLNYRRMTSIWQALIKYLLNKYKR